MGRLPVFPHGANPSARVQTQPCDGGQENGMKHPSKGAFALVAAVASSLSLLGSIASLADHDRETLAHTLLVESIVAAALSGNAGQR